MLNHSNKKVMILIPTYTGTVDALTAISLIQNVREMEKYGYTVEIIIHSNDCYVDEARNHLVDKFMRSDFSDCIFVDADIEFERGAMLKLMKHNEPLVAGAYPFKKPKANGEAFPVSLKQGADLCPIVVGGLVAANHAPTGLMRINRAVFETLQAAYPEFEFANEEAGEGATEWKYFGTGKLFPSETIHGKPQWWGEDVAFCKFCTSVGLQVWIEPNINFSHIGKHAATGNLHEYLKGLPKPAEKVASVDNFEFDEDGLPIKRNQKKAA